MSRAGDRQAGFGENLLGDPLQRGKHLFQLALFGSGALLQPGCQAKALQEFSCCAMGRMAGADMGHGKLIAAGGDCHLHLHMCLLQDRAKQRRVAEAGFSQNLCRQLCRASGLLLQTGQGGSEQDPAVSCVPSGEGTCLEIQAADPLLHQNLKFFAVMRLRLGQTQQPGQHGQQRKLLLAQVGGVEVEAKAADRLRCGMAQNRGFSQLCFLRPQGFR